MHGIQKSCIIVLGKGISEAGLSKEAKYFLLIWERQGIKQLTLHILKWYTCFKQRYSYEWLGGHSDLFISYNGFGDSLETPIL